MRLLNEWGYWYVLSVFFLWNHWSNIWRLFVINILMFLCANSMFSHLNLFLFIDFFLFIGHIFLPLRRTLSGRLHYWLHIICSVVCVSYPCVWNEICILFSGFLHWFETFLWLPGFLSSTEQPLLFQNENWLLFKGFYSCGLCYYAKVVHVCFALGHLIQTISD